MVEAVGAALGVPSGAYESWYKISSTQFMEKGGLSGNRLLLRTYKGSISALLNAVFPEYDWDPLKFLKAPQNYWNDIGTAIVSSNGASPRQSPILAFY